MGPHRVAPSFLLFATVLTAQTEPPAVPTPHVVLETVGPDGWRARLGPTNVGTMLASETGRAYWEPLAGHVFAFWRQLAGDEQAFAAARDRLLGYSGAIRIAARLDPNVRRADGGASFALVLEPDGRTDLAVVATDVRDLLEGAVGDEWTEHPHDPAPLELAFDGPDALSAPFWIGERLAVVSGPRDRLDEALGLAEWLTTHAPTIGKPTPGSPALRIRFDVPALVAAGAPDADEAAVLRALGVDSIGDVTFEVAAAGPHVLVEAGVGFRDAERGVFAAVLPSSQGLSPLLRLVPARASVWSVGRFDWNALADAILRVVDLEMEWAPGRARQSVEKELGVDVLDGFLAHATDEMLVVGAPFEDYDRAFEATWAIAIRLRDDTKFRAGLDEVLKQVKPFLSPAETTMVGDVALRRYGNLMRYDLWLGAGNGLFVLAGGRDAEDRAVTLLEGSATLDVTAPTVPDAFADLVRHLPPGHSGATLGNLDSIVGVPTEWWFTILTELLPLPVGDSMTEAEAEAAQERFRELLREHDLTRVRTASGQAEGRWRWRLFW